MSQYYTASQAGFRLTPSNSGWISQMAASGRSRELHIAIALAMVVNKMAFLPNGMLADQSAEEFFLKDAGVRGAELVGVINEMMPVDFRTALSVAKSLYSNRYENAFCPYEEFGADRTKGLASIFGLNNHLSEDVLECMRHHAYEITNAYERFFDITRQLKKE